MRVDAERAAGVVRGHDAAGAARAPGATPRRRACRRVSDALVSGLVLALLAAAPSAALVRLIGVEEVTFRWAAASGPVDVYLVGVARNGGVPILEQFVADTRVTLPVAAGESISVTVRALGRAPDGTFEVGALSEPSEEIRIQEPPAFAQPGLWTLHCASCRSLALQPFSEPKPVVRLDALGSPWSFEGWAWLGPAARWIWWAPTLDALLLMEPADPPRIAAVAHGEMLAGRRLVGPADLDGDDVDELVLHDPASGLIELWRIADGALRPAGAFAGALRADPMLADAAGDARTDLLWRFRDSGVVVAWTLEDLAPVTEHLLGTLADPAAELADTADYDGDGRDDLLWRAPDGALTIWYRETAGPHHVAHVPALAEDARRRVVGAARFDTEPGAEILVQDTSTGAVHVIFPGVATHPARELVLTPGPRWRVAEVTD